MKSARIVMGVICLVALSTSVMAQRIPMRDVPVNKAYYYNGILYVIDTNGVATSIGSVRTGMVFTAVTADTGTFATSVGSALGTITALYGTTGTFATSVGAPLGTITALKGTTGTFATSVGAPLGTITAVYGDTGTFATSVGSALGTLTTAHITTLSAAKASGSVTLSNVTLNGWAIQCVGTQVWFVSGNTTNMIYCQPRP